MKAAVCEIYGSPENVTIREVDVPTPAPDELLVRVVAVSLNSSDVEFLTGRPAYVRAWGLTKPKFQVLGSDVVGVVEAIGEKVTQFRVGDSVYGDIMGQFGGLANYAAAKEKFWMKCPVDLGAEEVATLPQAAFIALQGLRDKGCLAPLEHVAINGAGGGSGSFAIQMAKAMGARVTGVDRTDKLNFMKELGADQVIDYTQENLADRRDEFDLILDLVARRSFWSYRRALRRGGRYVLVGGDLSAILNAAFLGPLFSSAGSRRYGMLVARPNVADHEAVAELVRSGQVRPMIDKTFPLREAPAALAYLEAAHARGKVLVLP